MKKVNCWVIILLWKYKNLTWIHSIRKQSNILLEVCKNSAYRIDKLFSIKQQWICKNTEERIIHEKKNAKHLGTLIFKPIF
jgi:hypothetical protein